MKRTGLLLLGIIITLLVFSQTQEPAISWEQTVYKFGTFKEEAGPQTATFDFTNTGNTPLYITNVRASCGCTATEYTKEPVKPGGKGFVKVTYNPRNRPGKFNKSVTVTANTENPTTLLRIEGEVSPREKGIEDFYPKAFDSLRLRTSHLAFNQTFNNQTYTDTLGIVNMGAEPMTLTFESVPAHIKISVTPAVLDGMKPNEKHGGTGYITVVYDASKKKDWGFVMDRVNVIINGVDNNKNRISISATIEEDFTHLSEDELAQAPKIEFENTQFEFGTLKQGEKSTHNFTFKNTGKSDLVIRKIKASCGCTATNPEKMVIKAGETSHLTVTFNSNGKRGRQNKTITVITNDPKQSSVVLKVIGNVEDNTN
ncbi:MAG: DUF1573 domain-containing protein [Bacteroidales bacterium]|nr:DUF1573 domain-containing protein [Bacteroidales bacterium]MDY0142616.1 DUF1573 domain-containing protein [Bacteroidales bacterium]